MSSASELESSLISFAGSDSTSTWQGRKDGKWGGGGQFFKGGNHFQYFHLGGGDYSREAINQGTAIIQGNNYGTQIYGMLPLKKRKWKD